MEETEIKVLELVRRIRDDHYERTKYMPPEELLEFYRREANAANAEARSLLAKRATTNSR